MIDPRFALLGAAFSMIGSSAYAVYTMRGLARPNRVSWFLWALAPLIGFAAQVDDGVGWPAVSTLAIGLGPVVILAASFANRTGYWRLTGFDLSCGAVSVLALVLWATFDDPVLAVATAVIADLVGGIPTIRKAWRHPDTERSVVYVFGALNGIITVLSLPQWTVAGAAFPAYLTCLGVGMTLVVRLRGRRRPTASRASTDHRQGVGDHPADRAGP
ncbi:hypothetical protein [Gordonia soli]|uniref:Uncharacterized protein n=1 Tax=Gordonia soli NBRC 108243 TaxID=1223545 RepID=M0QPA9_9ACTN|nr:hypothetical protein [Gordonia soli]GAC70244.1 hypothetical protein GS4_33_00590 [Gordonia soli NBRC 108243]